MDASKGTCEEDQATDAVEKPGKLNAQQRVELIARQLAQLTVSEPIAQQPSLKPSARQIAELSERIERQLAESESVGQQLVELNKQAVQYIAELNEPATRHLDEPIKHTVKRSMTEPIEHGHLHELVSSADRYTARHTEFAPSIPAEINDNEVSEPTQIASVRQYAPRAKRLAVRRLTEPSTSAAVNQHHELTNTVAARSLAEPTKPTASRRPAEIKKSATARRIAKPAKFKAARRVTKGKKPPVNRRRTDPLELDGWLLPDLAARATRGVTRLNKIVAQFDTDNYLSSDGSTYPDLVMHTARHMLEFNELYNLTLATAAPATSKLSESSEFYHIELLVMADHAVQYLAKYNELGAQQKAELTALAARKLADPTSREQAEYAESDGWLFPEFGVRAARHLYKLAEIVVQHRCKKPAAAANKHLEAAIQVLSEVAETGTQLIGTDYIDWRHFAPPTVQHVYDINSLAASFALHIDALEAPPAQHVAVSPAQQAADTAAHAAPAARKECCGGMGRNRPRKKVSRTRQKYFNAIMYRWIHMTTPSVPNTTPTCGDRLPMPPPPYGEHVKKPEYEYGPNQHFIVLALVCRLGIVRLKIGNPPPPNPQTALMGCNVDIFEKILEDMGLTVIAKEEPQSTMILEDTLGQFFEVLSNLEQGWCIIELFQHFVEQMAKHLRKKYNKEIVSALISGCVDALRV